MNRKATTCLLLASILVLLLSTPTRAQVVGATVSGSITDPRGDAIPNAKVSAKNLATGVSTTTTTNATGAFSIANLNPADYEISANAAGFSTAVTKVTLTVGAKQEVNLALKVGQVTQIVEVTGAAPSVETTNSTISAEVDSTTVRELPLNGRDWASLATLQPGVAGVRTHEEIQQVGSHARGLGAQLSIDGMRPTQNSYRLNGVFINDYSNAGPGNVLGGNLGVDAIQEFSVLTSNFSAEYGYTSGGVVNAITKSGTNQFHGTAFEFIRNSALDARNFFENSPVILPKSAFRRNQFGASGGGPIKKDKIFIFGAYEGLRQTKGIAGSANVPSEQARMGILSTGNIIGKVNQPFLTFYPTCPAANNIPPGDTCRFSFSAAQVVPDNYYNFRGDVHFSDKDTLNASYYYDHSTFNKPDALDQLLNQFLVGRQGTAIEETHVFSPGLANTIRVGYNRTIAFGNKTNIQALNPAAKDPSFGIESGLFAPRVTGIGGGNGVPGLTDFTGGFNGQAQENFIHRTYQVFDDAILNIGKHSLKFGGMFIRLEERLYAPFTSNGTGAFASLSDFLQNIPLKVQSPPLGGLAAVSPHYMYTSIPAGYVQDDWKVRSNLTLNLGLRYEMSTIANEVAGRAANLPFPWSNPTDSPCSICTKKTFDTNPTKKNFEPRIGFAWDPFRDHKTSVRGGFGLFDALPLPYELALNNAQTSPYHINVTVHGCASTTPPNTQPCVGQGEFPHVNAAVLNEFLNPNAVPIPNQTWNFVERKPHRNYIYQYNLNIQRQLTGSVSLTVSYAGSRGLHNPFQLDDIGTVFPTRVSGRWLFPNPVGSGCLPGPPDCSITDVALGLPANFSANPTGIVPGLLINPNAVSGIQSTIWSSKSWYNALQVEVEKRMSHGLQVQASFTWSKTMDTSSGSFAGDNFAGDVTPTIPWWDLKIVRGLSDFNVGRNLVVNALWEVPTPASFHGPASFLAKGWEIGGIVSLSDGVPIWPLDGLTGDPMGQINSEPLAIPDRVPGCKLINPGNPNQYINPNCLVNAQAPAGFNLANCDQSFITNFSAANAAAIAAGTLKPLPANTCINLLGNLGRNTIIGPGLVNFDYSMVKNTKIPKISETFNVQFRAEFFNIFNHANFAPPVHNLSALDPTGLPIPGFGLIDSTQTPERQIQFALKLIW